MTLADTYTAPLSVQAILAALIARGRDGLGQRVEVTLLRRSIAAQDRPETISDALTLALPAWDDTVPYQAFKGSDGVWFVVAIVSRPNWIVLLFRDRALTLDRRSTGFSENQLEREER